MKQAASKVDFGSRKSFSSHEIATSFFPRPSKTSARDSGDTYWDFNSSSSFFSRTLGGNLPIRASDLLLTSRIRVGRTTNGSAGHLERLGSSADPCRSPCATIQSHGPASRPAHGLNCCARRDRKSTRLNSSHGYISYAVFCL